MSLLPRDSDNLYVILTARELNPTIYIVSRAEDDVGEKRLKRAGANRLVSTYRVAARKLADGIIRPYITDFLKLRALEMKAGRLKRFRSQQNQRYVAMILKGCLFARRQTSVLQLWCLPVEN